MLSETTGSAVSRRSFCLDVAETTLSRFVRWSCLDVAETTWSVVSRADPAPTHPETTTSVDSHTVPSLRIMNQQNLLSHKPSRIIHTLKRSFLSFHAPADSLTCRLAQQHRICSQACSYAHVKGAVRPSVSTDWLNSPIHLLLNLH